MTHIFPGLGGLWWASALEASDAMADCSERSATLCSPSPPPDPSSQGSSRATGGPGWRAAGDSGRMRPSSLGEQMDGILTIQEEMAAHVGESDQIPPLEVTVSRET